MFVSLHVYVLLDGQKIERLIVSLATIKASSKYTCKGKTIDIGLFKQKKTVASVVYGLELCYWSGIRFKAFATCILYLFENS